MSIEAMKQALEAKQTPLIELLERVPADARMVYEHDQFHSENIPVGRLCHEAAAALRAAIEQAEKRQWVELTDDEARALVNRATFGDKTNWQALVYMVDAKLKEKNT
jgi:hypothetical protein